MQGAYRLQENDMLQIMAKSTQCRNFTKNKTPMGVSVGCIGLRIASQGQDE